MFNWSDHQSDRILELRKWNKCVILTLDTRQWKDINTCGKCLNTTEGQDIAGQSESLAWKESWSFCLSPFSCLMPLHKMIVSSRFEIYFEILLIICIINFSTAVLWYLNYINHTSGPVLCTECPGGVNSRPPINRGDRLFTQKWKLTVDPHRVDRWSPLPPRSTQNLLWHFDHAFW